MNKKKTKKSSPTFIRPLVLSSSYLTLLPLLISTTCHRHLHLNFHISVIKNLDVVSMSFLSSVREALHNLTLNGLKSTHPCTNCQHNFPNADINTLCMMKFMKASRQIIHIVGLMDLVIFFFLIFSVWVYGDLSTLEGSFANGINNKE